MTIHPSIKAKHDIDRANRNFNASIDHFNKIQDEVYKEIITFYDKLALLSGGAISLSVSFLPNLKELSGDTVNQYSWLFLIGIFSFTICLVVSLLHRVTRSSSNFHMALSQYMGSAANRMNIENKAVQDGIAVDISEKSKADIVSDDELKKSEEESRKRADRYSLYAKLIEWTARLSFLVGILCVSAYFSIQIFDF